MARKRLLQISMVVLLLTTVSAQASSLSISIGSRGVHFSASRRPLVHRHHRHLRTYPTIIAPQPRIVISRRPVYVHRPVYRPILRTCVKPVSVTIWITNSNGSQQPVILRKTRHGYQGPRGECYATFPSNRQLRRAYGF
jgi:hypothetical protein